MLLALLLVVVVMVVVVVTAKRCRVESVFVEKQPTSGVTLTR
eukprot:COSAG01_NODE_578_length_15259_cov_10.160950_6_plen_42_part_00